MNVFDRVKKLAESQKIPISELERKLGMGANSLYKWKNQQPTIDKIERVADFFNVSTDYLLGRDTSTLSGKDAIDFKDFMDNSVDMTFFGENMTEAEMQRLKDIMIATFFEKLEERKNKENNSNGK